MIALQIQHVQGKSGKQASVQSQYAANISKKYFGGDDTPFDYVNKNGSSNIRYPKSDLFEYMFSQQMRGDGNPSIGKADGPLAISNTKPITSIYSIQRLHDILVPGCIRQGPGLNDNEVQLTRWQQKREAIQSQIQSQYGALNETAATVGRNILMQADCEGEQLVYQQFNHVAVDNMIYQIHGPAQVQPSKHFSAFYSSVNQPSLQAK